MRMPGLHFAYRWMQNKPHIEAAEQAMRDAGK